MLTASGLEVVEDGADADVMLVDTGADPEGALAILAELTRGPVPAVALLADEGALRRSLGAGARGAVLRSAAAERILAAILAVNHGLTVIDGAIEPDEPADLDALEHLEALEALTAREREVLELLADGLSNKRIAKRLTISEHTAKFHIAGILAKLDARTRTEAVVTAARRGLLLL
jgi:DNA-binding NarL/FixJ family response regulator